MRITAPGEIAHQTPVPDLGGQTGKPGRSPGGQLPRAILLCLGWLGGRFGGEVRPDPAAPELALKREGRQAPGPPRFEGELLGEPFVALEAGLVELIQYPGDRGLVVPLARQA